MFTPDKKSHPIQNESGNSQGGHFPCLCGCPVTEFSNLMKSLGLCLRGSRSIFDKNIESSMVEDAAVSELTSKIKV